MFFFSPPLALCLKTMKWRGMSFKKATCCMMGVLFLLQKIAYEEWMFGVGLKINSFNYMSFCFVPAPKPIYESYMFGVGLKRHRSSQMSFCSVSASKITRISSMSFCSASFSKRQLAKRCSSVLPLSHKAENIKTILKQRYGVFLVFEYLYILLDLFCPKYLNSRTAFKCGLLKIASEQMMFCSSLAFSLDLQWL
jgi:hypothetical protein